MAELILVLCVGTEYKQQSVGGKKAQGNMMEVGIGIVLILALIGFIMILFLCLFGIIMCYWYLRLL